MLPGRGREESRAACGQRPTAEHRPCVQNSGSKMQVWELSFLLSYLTVRTEKESSLPKIT